MSLSMSQQVNKSTTLNPNAAEFVPFSLRSSTSGSAGKAVLDRSEPSISDEEAHQFWRHQLPDDITPDFKVMGEIESRELEGLTNLSLDESTVMPKYTFTDKQEPSPRHINDNSLYTSASYLNFPTNQLIENGREVHSYNGNLRHVVNSELFGEHAVVDEVDVNPLEFLASQFPGLESESLSEVYFANGGDFNLTIEMLTQLELQFDSGFNQNTNVKTVSAPNLTALDFPALPLPDSPNLPKYVRDELHQSANPYQSSKKDNLLLFKSNSSIPSRAGSADFASAVRKMASQDSAMWKYERNGSGDSTIGSSRSSGVLDSSYSNGNGRSVYMDRVNGRNSSRAVPVWLETGEAVANMYSELREEARDHARLRNAYFEQARQAYLMGNKGLAKELSVKGQLHNMHMKAAHGKAHDSIYRLRNSGGMEMGRGHERMIDLHGLHVTEALHVLKHELGVLRTTARAAGQRLQVYICVGTGHHTRGSRTPARLPVAVQQYLLEDEGLDYSEPQPGLLRVVIY